MRRLCCWHAVLLAGVIAGVELMSAGIASAAPAPIHHVFIIVLENESASTTFGAHSPAPYLSTTLRGEGAYLPKYYATGHESNDNYISMISGQAPNPENQSDCQFFDDVTPGTISTDGQATGSGCVYPADVQTIAGQLSAQGLTWRDYDEDMGADPSRESGECAHPGLNKMDTTQKASATDQYATRHNPFVYFHSIIDDTTLCDTHVVNLDLLSQDLASAATTPNYVFITPNLCDDGHDAPCANGDVGGLPQADKFLRLWVPRITGSPAFRQQNGLLMIIFDEAATSDTSSCCGEIPGPGSPEPGITGKGGGDTGAVLLSPCIAPGTVSPFAYNHYTMLRSVEDIFGLAHLGYAQLPGERSFGSDVFTRKCNAVPVPRVKVNAPAIVSSVSERPRFTVGWGASGGAIRLFAVQVRQTSAGGRGWRTLLSSTGRRTLIYSGAVGATYEFRVRATTTTGITTGWATATSVVPTGVHVAGGSYAGKWRVVTQHNAWEGHAINSSSPGSSFSLSYVGGPIAIIGGRSPGAGTITVTVDGASRSVDLSSTRPRAHQVLFIARVRFGRHRFKIRVVSGGFSLEGLAIESRQG